MSDFDLETWKSDRRNALLSRNREVINAFMIKYGHPSLPPGELGEAAMHKAITRATDLPLEFRQESKAWLTARNLRSLDDGEL
jgi:hypothetical protein